MSSHNEERDSRPTDSSVEDGEMERWLDAIRERLTYVKELPVGTPCDGCERLRAELPVCVWRDGVPHEVLMCRICVRETLISFAGFMPPWWKDFF